MRSQSSRLIRVRRANPDDIPAVVDLFWKAFPRHGWRTRTACADYFHEILFRNPWYDPELPSWLAERGSRVVGFCGVVARPMEYAGRRIRAAVGCNFMVDPERAGALAAFELLKRYVGGPQDLTLADGATASAEKLWTRVGGSAPLPYNLHWIRLLRPARYSLGVLRDRAVLPRPAVAVARPFAAAVDAVVTRLRPNRFLRVGPGVVDEPLDAAQLAADLDAIAARRALRPVYDPAALVWLLAQVRSKPGGLLRARRVLERGRVLGWYLYYVCRMGPSEVVQLAARPGCYAAVLDALLVDAWWQGAEAVHGRLDPDGAEPLARRHGWLRREEPAMLVHARDPGIRAVIERGDAFVSRLEGEWWMRFASG